MTSPGCHSRSVSRPPNPSWSELGHLSCPEQKQRELGPNPQFLSSKPPAHGLGNAPKNPTARDRFLGPPAPPHILGRSNGLGPWVGKGLLNPPLQVPGGQLGEVTREEKGQGRAGSSRKGVASVALCPSLLSWALKDSAPRRASGGAPSSVAHSCQHQDAALRGLCPPGRAEPLPNRTPCAPLTLTRRPAGGALPWPRSSEQRGQVHPCSAVTLPPLCSSLSSLLCPFIPMVL